MAPFKKKAATRLGEARAAQAAAVGRVAEVEAARAKAILDEDDVGARKLDAELEELQRDARIGADRVRLLEQQAQEEEQAAVLQRRKDHVVRFTKELSDADQVADELQACIEQTDRLFRRLIQLREDARAAWWGSTHHEAALSISPDGCALSGLAIKALLMHEIYRVGARPFVGGTAGELKQVDLPGGQCPDHRLLGQPDKIEPFGARMRKASAAAVDVMRGKIPEHASATLPSVPDTAPTPRAASGNGGETPDPVRTPDQAKLAALLKRAEELSHDVSPEGEAKYLACIAEVQAASF
jgi:hypothetical protein